MKKDTHPTSTPTIFIDTSCGVEFVTHSTMPADETREVDGVTYNVVRLEISSASHPFFTGKQIFVDTARRVEKFEDKIKKTEAVQANRKGKKAKRAARATKKETAEA